MPELTPTSFILRTTADGHVHKATAAPVAPLAPKSAEAIADNISYQTSKTGVMPLSFETPDMYRATAESVREQLFENWNATYKHFHEQNPKQAYYISMEYLQGRALTNAIGKGRSDPRGDCARVTLTPDTVPSSFGTTPFFTQTKSDASLNPGRR